MPGRGVQELSDGLLIISHAGDLRARVTDLTGATVVVREDRTGGELRLGPRGLAAGMYLVFLQSGGHAESHLFLVE